VFVMILLQIPLQKPCYDFSFLCVRGFTQLSGSNTGLRVHLIARSVETTGGVHKGQGRSQFKNLQNIEIMFREYFRKASDSSMMLSRAALLAALVSTYRSSEL
jgi:hypothetical protein